MECRKAEKQENIFSQSQDLTPSDLEKVACLFFLIVAFLVAVDRTSEKVACPLLLFAVDVCIMDNKEKKEIK